MSLYGFTWGTMAQFGVVTAPIGWVGWAAGGIGLGIDLIACH